MSDKLSSSASTAANNNNNNLPLLPNGRKIKDAVISQGKKIMCFLLPPAYTEELHEEYDVITDELLLRKYRRKNTIGTFSPWEIEIGLGSASNAGGSASGGNGAAGGSLNPDRDLLKESSSMPVVLRQDTKEAIQFRIRNLNYDADVFSVSIDAADTTTLVVRTSNKKYFKKLQIPELLRAKLPLEQSAVSFEHERGTLIISYKKPLFLLAQENEDRKMRSSMKFSRLDDPKSGGATTAGAAQQACAQQ
jgi:hypothetical protein